MVRQIILENLVIIFYAPSHCKNILICLKSHPKQHCRLYPSSFVQMNLKEGDLIISKDGNIDEIAILDKDYPNYMLLGVLYKILIE